MVESDHSDGGSLNPLAPKRTSSSLSKRFGSLLGPIRTPSPPSGSNGSRIPWGPPDEEENRDPLPSDKNEMEARINFHLSELDRIKKYITLMNRVIKEHEMRNANVRQWAQGKRPTGAPAVLQAGHH